MQILATGITGRMGPSVAEVLMRQHSITGMGRRKPADCPFDFFQGDVTNLADLLEAAKGKDMILHMAARSNADKGDDDAVFAANVGGMYNVLEAARRNGIRKIVYASSGRAFGVGFKQPFSQPDYVPVDEEHASRPQDSYGMSKVMAEHLCSLYAKQFGMTILCLRFTWVVNAAEFRFVGQFLNNPGGRSFGLWSWIDERDAADSILLAINDHSLKGFHSFIITADDTSVAASSPQLMREFFPKVTEWRSTITGRTSLLSNEKAKRLLNFSPKYRLEDSPLADMLAQALTSA